MFCPRCDAQIESAANCPKCGLPLDRPVGSWEGTDDNAKVNVKALKQVHTSQQKRPKTAPGAVMSLPLAVILPPVGLIVGFLAHRKVMRSRGTLTGSSLAALAIVLSLVIGIGEVMALSKWAASSQPASAMQSSVGMVRGAANTLCTMAGLLGDAKGCK